MATSTSSSSSDYPSPAGPPSPAFLAAFREAAGHSGRVRFDTFMRLALFDPRVGYYRSERPRVGRTERTDFYTATSLGPLFGELVAAAAAKLLREAGLDPRAHTFVEIGAEPGGGVLADVAELPFAGVRTLRLGDELNPSGPSVLFSNELFDAQPLRRFRRCGASAWHELGVTLAPSDPGTDSFAECDLGPVDPILLGALPTPELTPDEYLFEVSFEAADLARELAGKPWSGLFIAFDYGKSFAELGHSHPSGTARAYFRHNLEKNLLARPGEQDLTAHVCWDWLSDALRAGGCHSPVLESQESFLVHHAGDYIADALSRDDSSALSHRKRSLMHLLHPAQMGQKFQVLHAIKSPAHAG